ncbi:MAG TPA: hypothetical protein VJ183_01000 [Chloroflexia bacterium]|nr:hypothetical protein [Chloroflexia bacterium]
MNGSALSPVRQVLRLSKLWLFAFISSVAVLLALSGEPSSYAAPSLRYQSACDLCSILPPGFSSTTTQQGGGAGKDFDCTGHYDPANVEIVRAPTLKIATDYVLQFQSHPDYRQTSSYGELAYEAPESATKGYDLAFKRGAIYVHIYTSLVGDNVENAKKAREFAQYVDSHISGILGSCPPYSTPDPVLPSPTTVPPLTNPTDTVPPATPAQQTQLDLIFDHLEIVQVVQDDLNRVQLYSGKKTLVRVFVNVLGAVTPVPNVNMELRAFGWHDDVGRLIAARNVPFTVPLLYDRTTATF